MIVDSMNFKEINDYFIKLGRKFIKKHKKFVLNSFKSDRFVKPKDDIIRFPVKKFDMGNNDSIYFCKNILESREAIIILFSIFHYRGKKYIARIVAYEDAVTLYTFHSMQRYFERFEGMNKEDIEIDEESIADVLTYNSVTIGKPLTTRKRNNEDDYLFSCRDGAFLGRVINNKITFMNTFITKEMMFELQQENDAIGRKALKDYTLNEYGIAI